MSLRKLCCAFIAGLALAAAALPASAFARDPILFVHGWSGNGSNWSYFGGRLLLDGYGSSLLDLWSYDWTKSNRLIAQDVANEVAALRARTGAARVDVVTHSMGGLNSRWYLKFLGGTANVDDWVSIGGPNHGTNLAYVCSPFTTSCDDMQYGSPFLTALNEGDETPGAVTYGTVWSPCDEVINPDTSTILSGATNRQVGCIGHISLLASESVYRQVREFVR
ncbi:MAG TPA: alpha/beta fold hydrolase [Conexibacter sp.]|nr:alpha/beta fold hydrolase [Conexibacter sp.]